MAFVLRALQLTLSIRLRFQIRHDRFVSSQHHEAQFHINTYINPAVDMYI